MNPALSRMQQPLGLLGGGGLGQSSSASFVRTTTTSSASLSAASGEVDHGWASHTSKDGKTFWHNVKTGKSTWDKPDCLKTELELLMAAQTPWKEYVAADGRPYWYNKETRKSVWDSPDDVKQLRQELAEEWTHFTDKTIATERLKTLFKLKNIGLRTKWEEGLGLIKSDSRCDYLSCLSTGEKKQAFAEYLNQLQKQNRERDRVRKVEGRKIFLESLAKWPSITPASLLSDFEEAFKSEWWITCFSPSERDDLFNEFIEEWEPTYWEEYKAARKRQRIAILDFLRAAPNVSTVLTWKEVSAILLQQEELKGAEPKDYLNCWEEYLKDTDRMEGEKLRSQIQRCRKKRREAFKELIHKSIEDGSLNARVSFCDFVLQHRQDPAYLGVVGVPIATPREIFEAETEALIESYATQKQILKAILKSNEIRIRSTATFEEFLKLLDSSAEAKEILDVNARLFYDSLKRRAMRREREKRRGSSGGERARHRSENEEEYDDEGEGHRLDRRTEMGRHKTDDRSHRAPARTESNVRDPSNEGSSYISRRHSRRKDQNRDEATPAAVPSHSPPNESSPQASSSHRAKRSRRTEVNEEGDELNLVSHTAPSIQKEDETTDDEDQNDVHQEHVPKSRHERKKAKSHHHDHHHSSSSRS